MCERIPEELREAWDNDGLMCSPDTSSDVSRVLIALDVTEDIVDYAISNEIDLIVSHHPLIFKPIKSVTEENHVSRKIIKLIKNDVSVFSFHTRADKVEGGVNDILCDLLGIKNAVPFGDGFLGRIGTLGEELTMDDFSFVLKDSLKGDSLQIADAFIPVEKVAVVGGDGKSYIDAALALGADTFVSGRIGYNTMAEANEMGINLIEAGHFFTEHPVTQFFQTIIHRIDPELYIEIANSNSIRTL